MIVFRCSANSRIGFGHLMRCRQLANELRRRKYRLAMFGPSEAVRTEDDEYLFDEWLPSSPWRSSVSDADQLCIFSSKMNASVLILDDHRVDEAYQLVLRRRKEKFVLFEGRSNRAIWADLLICAHAASDDRLFRDQIKNPACVKLVGMQYALLRDQFRHRFPEAQSKSIKKVFLTFGGGSDRGAFKLVLSVLLRKFPENIYCVTSGVNNPNNPYLKTICEKHPKCLELHIGTDRVADLMASCQFGVMAAGTSTLEAAALGLPMLLIAIADNQILPAKSLEKKGAAFFLGELKNVTEERLENEFLRISVYKKRLQMARNLQKLDVSGEGVVVVSDHVENLIS